MGNVYIADTLNLCINMLSHFKKTMKTLLLFFALLMPFMASAQRVDISVDKSTNDTTFKTAMDQIQLGGFDHILVGFSKLKGVVYLNIKVIIFKKGPEFHFYPGSNMFLKLDDDEVITLSNIIDAQSSNQAATISCILSYGNIDKIKNSKLSNINVMAGDQSFDFDIMPPGSRAFKKMMDLITYAY
jgi:hypothetical protein